MRRIELMKRKARQCRIIFFILDMQFAFAHVNYVLISMRTEDSVNRFLMQENPSTRKADFEEQMVLQVHPYK
jgi:hypothetical protein